MAKVRNLLRDSVVIAIVFTSSSAAWAQGTAEQRSACIGDAFRLCGSEIPDVSRITSCMKANFSKLSPGCKTRFHVPRSSQVVGY
jgi:hypothetical protein